MIKSMTGFGQGEVYRNGKRVVIELKSVNHRYSEIFLRLPRSMISLEDKCKRVIQEYISRGRIEGFFTIEDYNEKPVNVKVDRALAESYYRALEDLQGFLNLSGNIEVKDMMQFPGVLVTENISEDIEEQWWEIVEEVLRQALDDLVKMREMEGERLYNDIKKRVEYIGELNNNIEERAPKVANEYHERLKERLQEWIDGKNLDQERVSTEAAIFAEKANITEETVRLRSHLDQMNECIEMNVPVGRRMDFLSQEINREINTIASKANDTSIGEMAVEVKSELEKIREQIQNIE